MTRVSDKSSSTSVDFSINKTKQKLEDLQMKGTSLKRITKPSDDPSGNVELLMIKTQGKNFDQFQKNSNLATTILEYTENALKEITEIMNKAKDIAVGQASDIFNGDVRKSISKEIEQLEKQLLGIANRRLGNKYIFGGFYNDKRPFTDEGKYDGDEGVISLEIAKGFYVPTNIPGNKVFYHIKDLVSTDDNPINLKKSSEDLAEKNRVDENETNDGLFDQLKTLTNALKTNNSAAIQDLLDRFDGSIERLITLRTQVGSIINTIATSDNAIEDSKMYNSLRRSNIEDADIAELYTDIAKQKTVLSAVYKTSSQLLNDGLIKFLR